MRQVDLSLEGPSAVKSTVTGVWAGWTGVIWIKCYQVAQSALNFWGAWGAWAVGASIGGCADVPFLLLKLSACSIKFVSLAT
jgi:hypothetical protein